MKKTFKPLQVEMILVKNEDVLTTSSLINEGLGNAEEINQKDFFKNN